jgi:hypothetical protein
LFYDPENSVNQDKIMAGRTSQTGLGDWDDARDLDSLVQDKRSTKRANGSKRRRRNRRYENRMLTAEFRGADGLPIGLDEPEDVGPEDFGPEE